MRNDGNVPLVSVVLAVRNEERYLLRCLGGIAAQDYAPDRLEVVIADGRSVDLTREIVAEFAARQRAVKLLDNPAGRAAPGLNLAIRHARGDIIVRVDGHTVIDAQYVRQCVAALQASGADVVGGPRVVLGLSFWGRVIARILASPIASPARFHRSTDVTEVDTVFLGAFRRSTLDRVGLFDERCLWNEDYELNYRIRQAGGRICSTPLVKSTYFARETLSGLGLQFWRYGRGKAMVLRRHPGSLAPRHLAAPAFVVALSIGAVLAALGKPWPLRALVTLYSVAVGSVAQRSTGGGLAGAAAFVAILCVHLTWGSGLLLQFVNDWLNYRQTHPDAR